MDCENVLDAKRVMCVMALHRKVCFMSLESVLSRCREVRREDSLVMAGVVIESLC